jgi:hypothetical protein
LSAEIRFQDEFLIGGCLLRMTGLAFECEPRSLVFLKECYHNILENHCTRSIWIYLS